MPTTVHPWHEVLALRPDLLSGELEMAEFAADLYDVVEGGGSSVYREPHRFFSLTYPTHNLRDLVRNVSLRLAGKGNKAVHQINVTFGGGKTHALIALFHLANEPENLPPLEAVIEFRQHAGVDFTRARIALLPFDKIDIAKGLETRSPSGEKRAWLYPWTILAYQLAGDDGVRALHRDGTLAENDTPPAEPLITNLLRRAIDDVGAALVLIDEPLMYARIRDRADETLAYFFQVLTQAVSKTEKAALIASLLASDRSDGERDQRIALRFQQVFTREQEAVVIPVGKNDVAEILRRRLFTPASLAQRERFRAPVLAALNSIRTLDEHTQREGQDAEERYIATYPFHPDFLDVFYTKWTQVQGFQRTRGVLRILALALREAVRWDDALLVGSNVLLAEPGSVQLTDALTELARTAKFDVTDGRQHDWSAILESELGKAAEIEAEPEYLGLRSRPVQQAVVATFLHSQPVGSRATTSEMLRVIGQTDPDRIVLGKALRQWASRSWFLDESEARTTDDELPRTWRLGTRPNLKQMHDDASRKVADLLVERKLMEEIGGSRLLFNASAAPAVVAHKLPESPDRIDDDGKFHYAVLGPSAASEGGSPSAEAVRFINETTGHDRPRKNRNAIVLAVPSRLGIAQAIHQVRELLAWDEVRTALRGQEVDQQRKALLEEHAARTQSSVAEAIRQAYTIAVALSNKNAVTAYKLTPANEPLFNTIKADKRIGLTDKPVNAQALLPGGPYNLWREGESERPLSWIVGAFAEFAHLPKFLDIDAIRRTMLDGVRDGLFVMQLTRPDRTSRTFWCEEPEAILLREPTLSVVLSEHATLTGIPASLLSPGRIPEIWQEGSTDVGRVIEFFSGGRTMTTRIGASDESIAVPKVSAEVVLEGIRLAVEQGVLWYHDGPVSLWLETVPEAVIGPQGKLAAPPQPIDPQSLTANQLPTAWEEGRTTPQLLFDAVQVAGIAPRPWTSVRNAIDAALQLGLFKTATGSAAWTRHRADVEGVQFAAMAPAVTQPGLLGGVPPITASGPMYAEGVLAISDLQDLADSVSKLNSAAAALDGKLSISVRLAIESTTRTYTEADSTAVNETLGGLTSRLRFRR
jgi:hypothetical protein